MTIPTSRDYMFASAHIYLLEDDIDQFAKIVEQHIAELKLSVAPATCVSDMMNASHH